METAPIIEPTEQGKEVFSEKYQKKEITAETYKRELGKLQPEKNTADDPGAYYSVSQEGSVAHPFNVSLWYNTLARTMKGGTSGLHNAKEFLINGAVFKVGCIKQFFGTTYCCTKDGR